MMSWSTFTSSVVAAAASIAVLSGPVAADVDNNNQSRPPRAVELTAEGSVCFSPSELALVPLEAVLGVGTAKETVVFRVVEALIRAMLDAMKGDIAPQDRQRLASLVLSLEEVKRTLEETKIQSVRAQEIIDRKLDRILNTLDRLPTEKLEKALKVLKAQTRQTGRTKRSSTGSRRPVKREQQRQQPKTEHDLVDIFDELFRFR